MAIAVVCSGCKKRFTVSDQFAGKTGPCPQCKAPITVPAPTPEVKIHTPVEFESGGRSQSGKLLIKPIARKDARWDPLIATILAATAVGVAAVTFVAGGLLREYLLARTLGLLLVSPFLVLAAYRVLHDDDLEPYTGRSLYVRTAIGGAVYTLLWGAFGWFAVPFLSGEAWSWFFVAPPLLVLGTLAAFATLDLDFGNAFFHYSFYLLVTILLRWIAGMGWIWTVGAAS